MKDEWPRIIAPPFVSGILGVFLPLEVPGLLPLGPLPQPRGLVPQDRQQRHALRLDQLGHQPRHVERGIIAVKLADLEEIRVLTGDVRQLRNGDQRNREPSRGTPPRVSSSGRRSRSRIRDGREARLEARSSCDSHGSVFQRRLYSGCSIRPDIRVGLDQLDPPLDHSCDTPRATRPGSR